MIPVLAIPVLNRPDLLAQSVATIDEPVGTLLIIDNSTELGMGDIAEDALPSCVERLVVVEPATNLGVAASWNFAIRSYPEGWWCIANGDIAFAPGDLASLASAVETRPDDISCLVEFAAFGLTPTVVDRLGWFDENFVPIYYEDTDYRYRAHLEGVAVVDLPSTTRHAGSVSYRGNAHAADNARTYPANADYYRRKWGGDRGSERFTTPFDAGLPTSFWRLDRARLADQRWTP